MSHSQDTIEQDLELCWQFKVNRRLTQNLQLQVDKFGQMLELFNQNWNGHIGQVSA